LGALPAISSFFIPHSAFAPGHPGRTLDMSYTHRTPSKPRFSSAKLIQTTFPRHFHGGTI
jgi:hypothetical protein